MRVAAAFQDNQSSTTAPATPATLTSGDASAAMLLDKAKVVASVDSITFPSVDGSPTQDARVMPHGAKYPLANAFILRREIPGPIL